MATTQAIRKPKQAHTLEDAMNVLFTKLDEGIDDIENGRTISADELFAELDEMDEKGV